MRPTRIEVEGFSAYRQVAEVDFTDVDFFSLAGPTGSGKSSLIDAMIFALYGRVPRLGGNAVAPAISAGADRARVLLDFNVDGREYTAVRLAARTPSGGATVKEARLQEGETVLADGADHVTRAVEDLLRLRFDDFTRTVVLPQGEFARFLTATKSERQGLLRNLLGLDVYTRMRELARTRGAVKTERADSSRRALDALDVPDQDTAAAAVERREALENLSGTIAEGEKKLAALDQGVADARTEAERVTIAIERLEAITPPDRLEELDSLMVSARDELESAEEAASSSRETTVELSSALEELPTPDQLSSWQRTRERLAALEERLDTGPLDEARTRLTRVEERLEEAKAELAVARNDLVSARQQHAAHTLAVALVEGEPCPVCTRVVEQTPDTPELPALVELEEEQKRRLENVESLQEEANRARTEVTTLDASRAEVEDQKKSLLEDLIDAPDPEEMAHVAAEVERLRSELAEAKDELAAREDAAKQARIRLEDLAETSRRIGRKLTEALIELAKVDLEPGLAESEDVVVQWKELVNWRDAKLEELRPRLLSAEEAIDEAARTADDARAGLTNVLESHQIPLVEPYSVQVATALQTARNTVEAHEKARRDSAELAERVKAAEKAARVAEALATHLRANGFEQWLMAGALTELVDGANDLLSQLSGDGYSLHSDDSGTFSIIDHRNADEMRSVATLSGGETFLVSLALALSLAETLAAKGGSGLDAIILDEGFGTLDDESLDTVASVLEELTGRGLMVGVITHVKELAARAPVRYEVTREPTGARVRLVS